MKNETIHLIWKWMQVIASKHLKNKEKILYLIEKKLDIINKKTKLI